MGRQTILQPSFLREEWWQNMKFVQPIRDPRKIERIKRYFIDTNERNYVLFMTGINTGLRISDILPIQVWETKGTHLEINEGKTGKKKSIFINKSLREALDNYTKDMNDHEYLFKSRSKKHISGAIDEPISTSMAYKILRDAAERFGVKNIGTHSLRKTFGYHFYSRTKDIALLMELFNHSEESITLRYIGIIQDTLDDAIGRFGL